jgi:hypothetical protein
MFTSQQLRARAAEFGELMKSADHPDTIREWRRQVRTFTELADNEDWLANNPDKTLRSTESASPAGSIFPAAALFSMVV